MAELIPGTATPAAIACTDRSACPPIADMRQRTKARRAHNARYNTPTTLRKVMTWATKSTPTFPLNHTSPRLVISQVSQIRHRVSVLCVSDKL